MVVKAEIQENETVHAGYRLIPCEGNFQIKQQHDIQYALWLAVQSLSFTSCTFLIRWSISLSVILFNYRVVMFSYTFKN
jgi:hypothetical protein